jgi:hypothetical protein
MINYIKYMLQGMKMAQLLSGNKLKTRYFIKFWTIREQ